MSAAEIEHLCYRCIGDEFLSAEVKGEEKAVCMQCGKKRAAIAFRQLIERVDDAIQDNFQPSRNDEGQSFSEVIAEQAGLDEAIADRMQDWLSARRGYAMVRDGEEDIYDASWVEGGSGSFFDERYSSRWRAFKRSVREEARFFNDHARSWLDDVFHKVEAQEDWQGRRAVRTINPGDADGEFVRGRVAQSEAELKAFLLDPVGEIGPPPSDKATAGRMNAAGVSVFYGAFDHPTCRAEIRPPVGSHAVFARFRLIEPIRILDFEALRWTRVDGSIFDPTYRQRVERGAFLRTFGHEISLPVMPRDELFGYVPTQIVAEYLAHALKLDGIRFRSTQAAGDKHNIVLFYRASRVAPIDTSGLAREVDLGWSEPEDYDDSITIREEELPPPEPVAPPPPPAESLFDLAPISFEPPPDDEDHRAAHLEYIPDSLTVHSIRAVDYDAPERSVSRYRWTKKEMDSLPF